MNSSGILRYRADIRPIAWVVAIISLSLVPFLIPAPLWLLIPYGIFLLYLRSFAPYAQHNQGHLPAFHSRPLNAIYDLLLAQCTGYPTALWELHHVRGHHRHFLTPALDVARLTDLKTGETMSRWWYALRGNLTIVQDSIRTGIQEGRDGKKTLLPRLAIQITTQLLITGALLYWNAWLTLGFFILPNLAMSWFIWWESYQHHLDLPTTNAYEGSMTILDHWFNYQTFNIGHHTAHHEKPTLHWSLLPKRTEAILSKIPERSLREKYQFFARPTESWSAPSVMRPTVN